MADVAGDMCTDVHCSELGGHFQHVGWNLLEFGLCATGNTQVAAGELIGAHAEPGTLALAERL